MESHATKLKWNQLFFFFLCLGIRIVVEESEPHSTSRLISAGINISKQYHYFLLKVFKDNGIFKYFVVKQSSFTLIFIYLWLKVSCLCNNLQKETKKWNFDRRIRWWYFLWVHLEKISCSLLIIDSFSEYKITTFSIIHIWHLLE